MWIEEVTWWGETMIGVDHRRASAAPPQMTWAVRGPLRISSVAVEPPPRVPRARGGDGRLLGYVGGAAIAILGALALLETVPPDVVSMRTDELDGVTRPARGEPGGLLSGTRARVLRVEPRPAASRRPRAARRAEPKVEPGSAGILLMVGDRPPVFASVAGTSDFDIELTGDRVGESVGGFGISLSGVASGVGARWATIGTGRYGLVGRGAGAPSCCGGGDRKRGGARRRAAVPEVDVGRPRSRGGLDPAIVRQRIRSQRSRLRACYERALAASPGLGGTVDVAFQISPGGAVQGARAAGVSPEVSACVLAAVLTLRFPRTEDGGYASVEYPITFEVDGR